jgi:hypothetical protein
MDDAHMRAYAAWPTRMHGVRDGRVEHIVHPRGGQFDLASLRDWLLDACAKMTAPPAPGFVPESGARTPARVLLRSVI